MKRGDWEGVCAGGWARTDMVGRHGMFNVVEGDNRGGL